MTHRYNITGFKCNACIASARNALLKIAGITELQLQLAAPQATIRMQQHIPVEVLQNALNQAGSFTIKEADSGMANYQPKIIKDPTWLTTYKPILIVGGYILGLSLLIEITSGFNAERWMSNFMAGFFLVFSFFKFLDLKGFAESYSTYDIIARKWLGWGYVYAFIELGLGIAYLTRWNPLATSIITLIVMSVSIIGVLQAVLYKKKIKCACLGTVFNLPMSTITITEDLIMILMSVAMLLAM